jgi:hypothetical protein
VARRTTLVKLLDKLRVAARLSLNPAHNAQNRSSQVTMLQVEQERLHADFDWPNLRVERTVLLDAGQRYYDTPADIAIDRIERIEIYRDGGWCKLEPGIDGEHYSAWNSDLADAGDISQRSWPPRRWKIHEDEDIEIWPISDQNGDADTLEGTLKFIGIRNLNPLVDDTDRADLDDDMLVGFVAARILAASGAKDARLVLDGANARYAKLRGRMTPRQSFRMFGTGEPTPPKRIFITSYRPAGS